MDDHRDNPLCALKGMGLDRDEVLGSGFKTAPGSWVSVFRECSFEELERIAKEGLAVPPPEMRPDDIRREMETLDRFRPPHVLEAGISRLGAIYAAPTPEDAPQLPFRSERVILELKIDPSLGHVGDMHFITCLIPFIGVHRSGLDRYHGAFKKYWDGIIPLADFFRNYVVAENRGSRRWIRRPGAARGLPENYFSPEILVMAPAISRRHIRLVGSGPAAA